MPISLLPPNATPLERAIEQTTARIAGVETPVARLWDPATCPADVLPWLAWGLSVDSWDPAWSDATKRAAIAESIDLHRRKGTRKSVEAILARYDIVATIIEWWETTPRGAPHTFQIRVMLGEATGGRTARGLVDLIAREVNRTKPLREHYTIIQILRAQAPIALIGAARLTGARRVTLTLA